MAGVGLLLVAVSMACSMTGLGASPTPLPTPIPKPTAVPVERVTMQAAKGEAVALALPNGPKVDIPIGALYEDDTVSLEFADNLQAQPTDTNFRIVGHPFRFESQSKDTFAGVVTMTIPIDPSQLPPDVPASNVFAVGLVDNDWVRLRGKVDTNDNTITVSTLINGVYSWGYSTAPNLGGNPRNYLDTLTSQASTLADAQAAAAARQDEFSSRWDGCQFTVQPFSGQPPAGESSPALGENGQHTVILRPKDAASKGLAGDPAALMIGDVPVGHYGGATIGGSAGNLTVSELSTDNLLQVRCLLLSLESYARLEEANAVVDAMAKPEQTDFFPDDSGLITDWVGLQSETNPDGSLPPDWTTSPFVDETVDQAVLGGGDVRVTLTWGNTADLDLAVTDPEGNQIYYGSTSSSTGGQLDVDANGYCTEPLTTSPVENIFWSEGSAPTGEYLVQVAYSIECQGEGSTAYTVLIINGSDVQTYQGMVGEGDLTDVATFER